MFVSLFDRWAATSQQHACRNAMVASTRLTQRRVEAREVEEYLASLGLRTGPTDVPGPAVVRR